MTARPKIAYTVHVFRSSGALLTRITESCSRAAVAVQRAKKRIQKQGLMPHFYTFVATSN